MKNTRQITKAMQMVSAAKLRRAQERALAARPYAQMLTNVLKSLVSRAEIYDAQTGEAKHPLLLRREENNVLLIVVTGDKGLAGAFNTNILKAAAKFIASKEGKNIDVIAVGRKCRDYFKRRYSYAPEVQEGVETKRAGAIQVAGEQVGILNRVPFAKAREVAEQAVKLYIDQQVDSVYLVYNEFKSVMSQRIVVEQLLPIPRLENEPSNDRIPDSGSQIPAADYLYEPSAEDIFETLLPRHVQTQVYRALLESNAAFYAAQMTAMDSASRNASDMIEQLTLYMNKVRQAAITREIIEVVSGAEAL